MSIIPQNNYIVTANFDLRYNSEIIATNVTAMNTQGYISNGIYYYHNYPYAIPDAIFLTHMFVITTRAAAFYVDIGGYLHEIDITKTRITERKHQSFNQRAIVRHFANRVIDDESFFEINHTDVQFQGANIIWADIRDPFQFNAREISNKFYLNPRFANHVLNIIICIKKKLHLNIPRFIVFLILSI